MYTGKASAIEFFGDFVVFLESLAKMIQVGIAEVLDGKDVDNECKHEGAPLVALVGKSIWNSTEFRN